MRIISEFKLLDIRKSYYFGSTTVSQFLDNIKYPSIGLPIFGSSFPGHRAMTRDFIIILDTILIRKIGMSTNNR